MSLWGRNLIEGCARSGNMSRLSKLTCNKQLSLIDKERILCISAGNGHLDIVKRFYTSENHLCAYEWARINGHSVITEWLNEIKVKE